MKRRAMILAAGLGLRMRPLTNNLPKPLIPVAGKTMLQRAFDHLHEVGISKIVVNTHYLAELIEKAVLEGTLISHEDVLLETGGGIKKALPLLGEEAFFTLNGDSIWTGSESLREMDLQWDDGKMDALLLLVPREKAHGYEGKGDFFLSPEGSLSRRGDAFEAPYVYGGIQLAHPRLFHNSPEGAFSLNVLWDKALQKGRLFGYVHQGEWFHIGTPEELQRYEPLVSQLEKNALKKFSS